MADVELYKDDLGRKVYKITKTYTIKTEEFVKVHEGEDPVDIHIDQGGIDYSKINTLCLHEGPHTQAYYAEAFDNCDTEAEYMGTVVEESEDDGYAELVLDKEVA